LAQELETKADPHLPRSAAAYTAAAAVGNRDASRRRRLRRRPKRGGGGTARARTGVPDGHQDWLRRRRVKAHTSASRRRRRSWKVYRQRNTTATAARAGQAGWQLAEPAPVPPSDRQRPGESTETAGLAAPAVPLPLSRPATRSAGDVDIDV